MIKKLRRKFMAVAMISVTLVILIMMVALNVVNYWKMDQRAEDLIGILEQNGGSFPKLEPPDDRWETEESRQQEDAEKSGVGTEEKMPPDPGKGGFTAETPFETRYFTVILTRDGEVVSIDTGRIAAVSTEQAVDLFMLS